MAGGWSAARAGSTAAGADGLGGSGGLHRRDETVAAARDRLDVGRLRGIVAERLAQLGHRLRQRVVGHGHVGPQRREQLVLGHERGLPRGEVQQQVDDLRRQGNDVVAAQQPVGTGVHREGTEAVCHVAQVPGWCLSEFTEDCPPSASGVFSIAPDPRRAAIRRGYSCRRAPQGSVPAALRAGTRLAEIPTRASRTTAPMRMTGSPGLTS